MRWGGASCAVCAIILTNVSKQLRFILLTYVFIGSYANYMKGEIASESANSSLWQRFGNWISEHGDEHGFIIGGFMIAGLITGFVLRECLDVQYSAKVPSIAGLISFCVTVYGIGVINIFQPDESKHYSVAAQAVKVIHKGLRDFVGGGRKGRWVTGGAEWSGSRRLAGSPGG